MAVNTNIQIPFIPQTGVTGEILAAIQQANQEHIQRMTLANQQALIPSQVQKNVGEAAQAQGAAGVSQAQVQAGLPQAQATAETASAAAANSRAQLETIQGQIAQENNPLTKAQLQAQARNLNADASLNEAKAALMKNPGNVNAAVDQAIDPQKYPELNKRTKGSLEAVKPFLGMDPQLTTNIIGRGTSEIDAIERETDPQVIQARVQQAVETQKALYGGGAVSGVAPHLVGAATQAAAKAGTDYATAQQTSDDFKGLLDLSKAGNKVAYSYDPVAGVLQFNTSAGTKRINFNEIEAYGGAGSALDRVQAWLGKQSTGASIAPDVLKDMGSVQQMVEKSAYTKYQRDIQVVNKSYGSKFEPLDFSAPKTESQAPALDYARDAQGNLHSAPAGTALPQGWTKASAPTQ